MKTKINLPMRGQKSLLEYYNFSKAEQKKYPVVTGILKQLTPERVEKEIEEIQKIKFPPELQKWMKEYQKIGGRNTLVFEWCYKINTGWFLIDVSKKYQKSLIEVKTLFNMFIVLLDDISEEKKKEKLLNELLKIPFNEKCINFKKINQAEREYLKFSTKVWHRIKKIMRQYPQYQKVEDIMEFDIFQFIDAVRYGYLVNKNPYVMNGMEYWIYFPQSMQIIIDTDLDLMCSLKFDMKKMGEFREIILSAQRMARIGNWLTTWTRETIDNDFTSEVFPYALRHNIFDNAGEFQGNKNKIIDKIKKSQAENYLFWKWEEYYEKIDKMNIKNKSINIRQILKKFEYLLFMHLISQGYK